MENLEKIKIKHDWTELDAIIFDAWLCVIAIETLDKVKEYVR